MAFKTLIVSALAVAGAAAAQSSSCSASATMTLQSQGDASALSGCTTFTGSIAIQTGIQSAIQLDNIQAITGDLVIENGTYIPSFSASGLKSIGGTFRLSYMTLLTSLNFPLLSQVGTISWITLPRLSSLTFGTGVSQAGTVLITDTALGSLDGLPLNSVKDFSVIQNQYLQEIDLPIKNIATAFQIAFNNNALKVSLPNLAVANNMTFRNVSSVVMPSLAGVNQSLGFYGCTFQQLSMPNLTTIGGDISFVGNNDVTNISAPILTSLGGALQLSANADLVNVTGFPELAKIAGAIDVNGNFSDLELPALKTVQGACNLQSTADIDPVCSHFNGLHPSVIQGKVTCAGKESSPGGLGSTPSSSSTSSATGAAGRDMYARSSAITGVMGVLAAMFGML
ncbi:hypothetical protein K461DRAFT_274677 [Myriangium duriaei CBS 260.36]|uniref:Receptor L-domain domain-containing protein n=1 Tax=Myriangium duriaei CBS 260.36 TaxID=1168546 RepID=A0A9P4J6L2_9PEZI|nr:hypothetical protein K461DRAFT_274677 [Myriangium duriaei CBS 260.36]